MGAVQAYSGRGRLTVEATNRPTCRTGREGTRPDHLPKYHILGPSPTIVDA